LRHNKEVCGANETCYLNKSKLTEGSLILLAGMRQWNQAILNKVCIHLALGPLFSNKDCLKSIRYIDEMQCLILSARDGRLEKNLGDEEKLSPDEATILLATGLIEKGKFHEASRALRRIMVGPLNFTLMRILFDLVSSFNANDLTLGTKTNLFLVVS
jgi:hypothetical protein